MKMKHIYAVAGAFALVWATNNLALAVASIFILAAIDDIIVNHKMK
jgi:hypothetical protein